MNINDLSIRWKVAGPIILAAVIGIATTVFFTGYKTESIVVNEVKNSTLKGYRDTVLNSLTTMMYAGSFRDQKSSFLEQMTNIVDLRVIRAEILDKDMERMASDVLQEVTQLASVAEDLKKATAEIKN